MTEKGKGRVGPSRGNLARPASSVEDAKRLAELRTHFVVVPAGDEARTISCPICKEVFKAEFNEDDEDWIWKNAVKVESRVSNRISSQPYFFC